jgi:hypothetical protein
MAPVSEDRRSAGGGRRLRPVAAAAALLLGLLAVSTVGIERRWFRAPFPGPGKTLSWWIGRPEPAYNFDVVVPGLLYRSGRPDARFLRYLRETHGVEQVVSLTGESEVHAAARELGLGVEIVDWSTDHLPPRPELERVLDLIDSGAPVLLHCAGGADRTGYTVAAYRVSRQQWSLERAVDEMERFGHDVEDDDELHAELRAALGP